MSPITRAALLWEPRAIESLQSRSTKVKEFGQVMVPPSAFE